MNKKTLINAIIAITDENSALKHKVALLTKKDGVTAVGEADTASNRFTLMCYERGLAEIVKKLESRFDGDIEKSSTGAYSTYEEWINSNVTNYSNPFDNYDTRFLLRDFSINELLKELEPWLHKVYEKKVEIKRLNDLKESKKE